MWIENFSSFQSVFCNFEFFSFHSVPCFVISMNFKQSNFIQLSDTSGVTIISCHAKPSKNHNLFYFESNFCHQESYNILGFKHDRLIIQNASCAKRALHVFEIRSNSTSFNYHSSWKQQFIALIISSLLKKKGINCFSSNFLMLLF